MFAKLLAVILSLALCGCVLLAARQARIQAAHDLAEARLRIVLRDNELWRMRAEIAARVTPEEVRRLASAVTPLRPLVPDRVVPLVEPDARYADHAEDPDR